MGQVGSSNSVRPPPDTYDRNTSSLSSPKDARGKAKDSNVDIREGKSLTE